MKLCPKETTKQSFFKENLNRGTGLVWLSLLLSKVPEKRAYYLSMEISYAELHLQKIIKRALMIENPRNGSKSHVFIEKLLFFLTVNTFREHKNAKNQVTLQICDCPAYFTHMEPLAFQATAQILQ